MPASSQDGRSRLDENRSARQSSREFQLIVSSKTYLHGLKPVTRGFSPQLPMMIVSSAGDDDNHRDWGDHRTRPVSWEEPDAVGYGILASPVRRLYSRADRLAADRWTWIYSYPWSSVHLGATYLFLSSLDPSVPSAPLHAAINTRRMTETSR
jgi:hypothetical protein